MPLLKVGYGSKSDPCRENLELSIALRSSVFEDNTVYVKGQWQINQTTQAELRSRNLKVVRLIPKKKVGLSTVS